MASNEDTDDLYADLYGTDGGDVVDLGGDGDDKAHASDEQDLIGYDEDEGKTAAAATGNTDNVNSNEKADSKPAAAPSTGSFIPPPSSAPMQPFGTGMQIKGSFIPPPAAANSSLAHSQSDVRDLTPASHNDASNDQQSASYPAQGAEQGNEGQDGGAEGQASGDRPLQPHEMPEEG